MSEPSSRHPKIFCSHRNKKKAEVRKVAEELRRAGIDAWLDEWEIAPGDNFVAAINQALEECDVGLAFLSDPVKDVNWASAEVNTFIVRAVEDKMPVIPILLNPEAYIPALLRSYSAISADEVEKLVKAIYHQVGIQALEKPELGAIRVFRAVRRFQVELALDDAKLLHVKARLDGEVVAQETSHLGPRFAFSYADFLQGIGNQKLNAAEAARSRDRELSTFGEAVGEGIFPGEVGAALEKVLGEAEAAGTKIELVVETDDPKLLSIPVEAARLPSDRVLALQPGVRVLRRLTSATATAPAPQPGPLKILVAIGAPDEDQRKTAVLDIEREVHTILDAVNHAQQAGDAFVRVLEVGSLEEIRKALQEQQYHVLHLSGHGGGGSIELEDEDGSPQPTPAKKIADAIREAAHKPLVFLSACHGSVSEADSPALVHGLLENGVPLVLAMQASVTDPYATGLAGRFYGELSRGELPLASAALANARAGLERERRQKLERAGEGAAVLPAEYATPALFCGAEEKPILNRSLPREEFRRQERKPSGGAVPYLEIDELIGRRSELRTLMRVIEDHPKSVTEKGRLSGAQLIGIGGVGKSALAGRAMQRLANKGWIVAAITGELNLQEIGIALATAMFQSGNPNLAELGKQLAGELPDPLRLSLIADILQNEPVLLVLDNFETNLDTAGKEFLNPATAAIMHQLCSTPARRGKLLVTSRFPVPGADSWLDIQRLGPLSDAETRKLILRLERIQAQEPESLRLIRRMIGGHPRMLEYLDGILNQGRARLDTVIHRLRVQARELEVDLEAPAGELDEAIRMTLQLGAADILLDELLEVVGREAGDRELLQQVSVFERPVPVKALAHCQKGETPSAGEVAALAPAIRRLIDSSLLTPMPGEEFWVHRWTAEALRLRTEDGEYHETCRRAGEYLMWRVREETHSLLDGMEATRLFLAAEEYDTGFQVGYQILQFLKNQGQSTAQAALAREMAAALPEDYADRKGVVDAEAQALLSLGFTGEALERYKALTETHERLSRAEPDRADYQWDVSVSHERLGDLLRGLGDGETARSHYEKSLAIWEGLISREPDRTDYQRGICVPYARLGDLLLGLGDGETARSYYEKSHEILVRLSRAEPDRADYQRDLSVSYDKLGDLLVGLGEGETARSCYEKSHEILERLSRSEPDRADYQRDLSVSYNKLGDLLRGLGDGETARSYYEKSLAIRERLSGAEPDRADYRRDVRVSYERLGDVLQGLGEGETARSYYEKSLEIAERLSRAEPDRVDYQTGLVVSLERVATRPALERALGILERLNGEGRLTVQQQGWIPVVQKMLGEVGEPGG